MKPKFCEIVEKGRIVDGSSFATEPGDRFGAFFLRYPKSGERLKVIVGNGEGLEELGYGEPWDHVSVSCERRCPTWDEMCWIKALFFEDCECVVQYHPAKKDYVNCHPFVLHLWKPLNVDMPMPPIVAV